MPDHYNDTIRLAKLIGLYYHASDKQRVVYRQVPREKGCTRTGRKTQWVPWRPFERWIDVEPVTEWCVRNGDQSGSWKFRTPAKYCQAVLAAFDQFTEGPKPIRDNLMERPLEYCFACGEPTGKAGKGDGSIYCNCGAGPLCDECWEMHNCPHKEAEERGSDEW